MFRKMIIVTVAMLSLGLPACAHKVSYLKDRSTWEECYAGSVDMENYLRELGRCYCHDARESAFIARLLKVYLHYRQDDINAMFEELQRLDNAIDCYLYGDCSEDQLDN